MREITRDSVNAFLKGKKFSRGNTTVSVVKDHRDDYIIAVNLYLHGNKIASKNLYSNHVWITTAGWNTKTTRERLNGIPGVEVNVSRGVLYLNGEEWDGKVSGIIIPNFSTYLTLQV